jgi:hypothetical protein
VLWFVVTAQQVLRRWGSRTGKQAEKRDTWNRWKMVPGKEKG